MATDDPPTADALVTSSPTTRPARALTKSVGPANSSNAVLSSVGRSTTRLATLGVGAGVPAALGVLDALVVAGCAAGVVPRESPTGNSSKSCVNVPPFNTMETVAWL